MLVNFSDISLEKKTVNLAALLVTWTCQTSKSEVNSAKTNKKCIISRKLYWFTYFSNVFIKLIWQA